MSAAQPFCRIGIDVGGTFTDFVLANARTGAIMRYKEPSVPEDPSLSVERGLPRLLEIAGVETSDVALIVHGTTIGLNATIQRRGARLGMVVNKGNRGILEIARAQLPSAFDFVAPREEALVPRDLVLETSARIGHDGAILSRATDSEVGALADAFKTQGVEAVVVMLMHSFSYPELEVDLVERLRARLDGVMVTASSDIWPEKREYERAMIGLLNTYTQPLMVSYFARLQKRVSDLGVKAPIYMTANNGGILSLETARSRPIDTILSGPASGVVAASRIAGTTDLPQLITVDIGGTSADMALVHGTRPASTMRAKVGDFPLVMPVIGVTAIGAGGGSIVWVDSHGVLKIGPRSAGASPGPICYGRGGTEPTITDCYLVTGLIDGSRFLGGRIKLDLDAARSALAEIGRKLNFTGEDIAERAAEAAIRVATAILATEMGRELAHRGDDARDYALLGFGGAGPTHANLVAREAGMKTTVLPALPATFCALGAILADVKRDYVISRRVDISAQAVETLNSTFKELEKDAADWIAGEGVFLKDITFEHLLDMRYQGQGFDLQVLLPQTMSGDFDVADLITLFHDRHEENYGYRDEDSAVIAMTVRVRVIGKMPEIALPTLPPQEGEVRPFGRRNVYHNGAMTDVAIYDRRTLGAGAVFAGPAVIEQEDTSIWVLPDSHCTVDAHGNILITGQEAASGSA